eukprot:scaffold90421_cov30-Tisochrysis_lutea.AAC.1
MRSSSFGRGSDERTPRKRTSGIMPKWKILVRYGLSVLMSTDARVAPVDRWLISEWPRARAVERCCRVVRIIDRVPQSTPSYMGE